MTYVQISIPKGLRHIKRHKFTEHWKNEKQNETKQKGLVFVYSLEEDLSVLERKERRKRGRKEGRKEGEIGVLGRAWNKCQDAQLSWPCYVVLGMFITVPSLVTSSFYPINLAKLLV